MKTRLLFPLPGTLLLPLCITQESKVYFKVKPQHRWLLLQLVVPQIDSRLRFIRAITLKLGTYYF